MTLALETGTAHLAGKTSVTWSPLAKQVRELDTTFLLDPDDEAAYVVEGQGGLMSTGWDDANSPIWSGAPIDTIEGKYRKGIHAVTAFAYEPAWMLLGTSEFHIEFWAKCDTAWADCGDQKLVMVGTTNNSVSVQVSFGVMTFRFRHQQDTSVVNSPINYSVATNAIPADTWTAIAMSYSGGVFTAYLNGVSIGTPATGLIDPEIWGDTGIEDGLQICGSVGTAADKFAISDLRISRKARTPNGTVTVGSSTEITVSSTPTGNTTDQRALGQLGGYGVVDATGDIEPIHSLLFGPVKCVRTGIGLGVTPIKAGAPDATHPDLGQSGTYSYDWTAIEANADWVSTNGADNLYFLGWTPPYFGGSGTPIPPDIAPHGFLWVYGSWDNTVPNDFTGYATACADALYHVVHDLGVDVEYVALWNEPDLSFFWSGTQTEFFDCYAAVAAAIRALLPDIKLVGPSISGFGAQAHWIDDFIAYCATNSVPIDAIEWHYYSGDPSEILRVRRTVDASVTANSFPTPIDDLIIGECDWTIPGAYAVPAATGKHPYMDYHYHIDDWHGAWVIKQLIQGLRHGVKRNILGCWTEVGNTGFEAGGLSSLTHPWTSLNAYSLWSLLEDANEVEITYDERDPGIEATAFDTGAVVISCLHYRRTRDFKVRINTDLLDGPVNVYVVDDEHSNYYDAGASHADLESYEAEVEGGSLDLTLRPRSAVVVTAVTPPASAQLKPPA